MASIRGIILINELEILMELYSILCFDVCMCFKDEKRIRTLYRGANYNGKEWVVRLEF